MKSNSEIRLQCIQLATVLATAKLIQAKDVIATAMEYELWISNGNIRVSDADIRRLAAPSFVWAI